MRRGFKTEARDVAAEVRGELELSPFDPLDPWRLAKHLEIPVWSLSSYRDAIPDTIDHLSRREPGAFSAMIACQGLRRVIIHNDGHALTRQRADISHELAHALLLHQPYPALAGRPPRYDKEQEEEARWLGGVLQVTDQFCVSCCRSGMKVPEAALHMGVSQQMMRWRMNMSGAERRATRTRTNRRGA